MKSLHRLFSSFNAVKQFNSVIAIPAVFLLSIIFVGCSSKQEQSAAAPPPPSLPVASIVSGTQTTYQDYPASIEGTDNVEVRPQVSGTLDKVFVDEGALVSAGQPIFKINEQPYRAALNNAVAAQHSAEAAVVNANLEVERLTALVQNKVISDFQLKSAKANAQAAKANVEQAKANVSTASINLGYTVTLKLRLVVTSVVWLKNAVV